MRKTAVSLILLGIMTVFAPDAMAVNVYLKDGSIIKASKVSRAGDRVTVLINRDSITQFNVSEVDMKRTFRATAKKTAKDAVEPAQMEKRQEPATATAQAAKPAVTVSSSVPAQQQTAATGTGTSQKPAQPPTAAPPPQTTP